MPVQGGASIRQPGLRSSVSRAGASAAAASSIRGWAPPLPPSMLATRLAKQLSTRLLPHCTRARQRCTLGAWIAPKLATSVHRLSAGRPHCRRWWANTRFLHSTVAAEESNLLRAIRSGGAQGGVVELEDVVSQASASQTHHREAPHKNTTPCGARIRTKITLPARMCCYGQLKVIDAHYDYTPVAFANGALENAPGENVGSCKLVRCR
jgi:hypothetical protein